MEYTTLDGEYFGKYQMMMKSSNSNKYRIAIGPEIHCAILAIFCVSIGLCFLFFSTFSYLPIPVKIVLAVVVDLIILVMIINIFLDPGVVSHRRPVILDPSKQYSCRLCGVEKGFPARHCRDCQVCIEGFDHHCMWLGKCVGKNNLWVFYFITAAIPLTLVFLMATTVLMEMNRAEKNRIVKAFGSAYI